MKTSILCVILSCASALTINDKNHSLQMRQKQVMQVMDHATLVSSINSNAEKIRHRTPTKVWDALENSGLVELTMRVFNDTDFVKTALKHKSYNNSRINSAIQKAVSAGELPKFKTIFEGGFDPELQDVADAASTAVTRHISDEDMQRTYTALLQVSGPDSPFAEEHFDQLTALMLPILFHVLAIGTSTMFPTMASNPMFVIAGFVENIVLCRMVAGAMKKKVPNADTFGQSIIAGFMDQSQKGTCLPQVDPKVQWMINKLNNAISQIQKEKLKVDKAIAGAILSNLPHIPFATWGELGDKNVGIKWTGPRV